MSEYYCDTKWEGQGGQDSLDAHGPLQAYFTEIFGHDLGISEFI